MMATNVQIFHFWQPLFPLLVAKLKKYISTLRVVGLSFEHILYVYNYILYN